MFEKEAEEYATRPILYGTHTWKDEEKAFKDGAEFGYNKAKEWQYVKDGLPKISGSYLVFTGGKPFILDYDTEAKDFGYWYLDVGDNLGVRDTIFETVAERDEDKVIAWKELPEPPKERWKMREFTPEEKELIINTEITPDCFEKWEDYHYEEIKLEHFPHPRIEGQFCTIGLYPTSCFESMARNCEVVRRKYIQTKNEHYFDILVRLLPNSYKVVKL